MREDLERVLSVLLKDVPGATRIGGGPVPLPSFGGEMSEHLFVNVTFGDLNQREATAHLLERLRDLAFDVLVRLRQGANVSRYATICLSLFVPISDTEGLRIYRTRLKTRDLPRLDRDNLKKLVTGEESGKPELHQLLKVQ